MTVEASRRSEARAARSKAHPKTRVGCAEGSGGEIVWAERWIAALSRMPGVTPARVERGLAYACEGRVKDLRITMGTIEATVHGSRPKPYEVTLKIAPLDDATWERAIESLSERDALWSALLSGEMPRQIDRVFRALGVSLFPSRDTDLSSRCSCPDWASSCKHVAAVHHAVAVSIARDPFLLFELRGRTREQVLGALRRARSGGARRAGRRRAGKGRARHTDPESATSPEGQADEGYERALGELTSMRFHFEAPPSYAAILRPLGRPPSWSRREPIESWLRPTYEAASGLAQAIALGEPSGERDGSGRK